MQQEIKTCRCGKPAAYARPHEGRALCVDCFVQHVERAAAQALGQSNGKRIAIGMSGGSDSAVAAYIVRKLLPSAELVGLTIDEGIGDRSTNISAAAKLAEHLGIGHRVLTFEDEFGFRMDGLAKQRPCTTCGVLRRWLLNHETRKSGADGLVLGINADDEAESVLLSILRGDRSRFTHGGSFRLKPLVMLSKADIEEYARLNDLPFVKGECPFLAGGLRWRIRRFLNELEHDKPGIRGQIISFGNKIRLPASSELKRCSCGEPTSRERCRACELLDELRKYCAPRK